jgi:hypothetical protein
MLNQYPGEEQFGFWPETIFYLQAQAATAGVYVDASGKGNNFTQPIVGQQPPLTANANASGFAAWSGNGANNYNLIGANGTINNFVPAVADLTLFFVTGPITSDAAIRALAGTALPAALGWVVGYKSGAPYWSCTGGGTTFNPAVALSATKPNFLAFAWSNVDQLVGFCINGGAWQTQALTSANVQAAAAMDVTLLLMNSGSPSYSPANCNVFLAGALRESFQNAGKATKFAQLQSVLRAKYGTA